MTVDIGDVYQVAVAIRDSDGELTNPATAVLSIALPDLEQEAVPVPLPPAETGVIRVDWLPTTPGLHRWRMVTTGPQAAFGDAFVVADPNWPAFLGLAEVKRHLRIPADDDSEDENLRGFILSASAVVEDIVGVVAKREFRETASGGQRHIVLERAPVERIVDITVNGAALDPGDVTASPSGLVARRSGSWPAGLRNIEIVYVAGKTLPPANVLDATRELIRINFRPQQGGNYSAFDGGTGDDFGNAGLEASLQGNLRLGFFVPNTVIQRLSPDQRPPVVL